MKLRHIFSLFFLVSITLQAGVMSGLSADDPSGITADSFRHHFIAEEPLEERGQGYAFSALADLTGNGRLDYVTAVRGGLGYWFENQGDGDWKQHELGELPRVQLGATAMDVDADGWTDIVIGGYWFRNPGSPHDEHFARYEYDSRITAEVHDIVTADINGDGKPNIVVLSDGNGCFWYEIPEDPDRNADWPRHTITMDVLNQNDNIHGGFSPNGVGDLTGNGYPDIVMPDRWYENRQQGKEWVAHPLPWGHSGPWGLSARSWIADVNNNELPDIVIVDSDQTGSRAAWLENEGGSPPSFKRHDLPQTAAGRRGSFHSLGVADFNGNGLLDIFTVEQEHEQILPQGAPPRWYIWENQGDETPTFVERVIFDGRLGGHDAGLGDITGNGRIDIIAKIWSRWSGNANAGRKHIGLLENVAAE